MDFDVPSMMVAVVFSLVGFMYMKHGKKAREMKWAISGICLVIFGYFTPNVWWTLGIGLALSAVPFLPTKPRPY